MSTCHSGVLSFIFVLAFVRGQVPAPLAPFVLCDEEQFLPAVAVIPRQSRYGACNFRSPPISHPLLSKNDARPRSLHNFSQLVRFLTVGVVSQALFMTGYNFSVMTFEPLGYAASLIYAVFYTFYIPVGHLLQCFFVIGWPAEYLPSLMSNAPIGLTAMAIGMALTGFLSKVRFNAAAKDWISSTFGTEPHDPKEEEGEFYSSLVVMIATGVWCYVLSVYVNAAPVKSVKANSEKDLAKEL
jgi:hypothetical protein